MLWLLFSSSACVPDSGKEEDQRAAAGKDDEEWRRKHVPGDDRASSRQNGPEEAVDRAGLSIATALLVERLHRALSASQGVGAGGRAHHPSICGLAGTIDAEAFA